MVQVVDLGQMILQAIDQFLLLGDRWRGNWQRSQFCHID
jgi:hypothetical protein